MLREKRKEYSLKLPDISEPRDAEEVYYARDTKIAISDNKYMVLAPPLPENFENILEETVIQYAGLEGDDEEEKLLTAFLKVATNRKMDPELASIAWYHIRNTCLHFGKITPLFNDPYVEDISCSGPDAPVFVYHQKYGYLPTNISFNKTELTQFIHSLAQKAGFILSADNPIIDATLPDGSRINVALEVAKEPSYTIRKVKQRPLTPKEMVENQTWSAELAALIWLALENRCSLMFIGGTGTGKTTAMNAAAFFIPPYSKIVSIEDTYEIMLPHKNWTPLIVKGDTTTHDLLKATLRQRPEYIIIGEARGIEVREMFSAMGVGHAVLTTFHGANAQTVAKRLFGDPFQLKSDQFKLLDFILTMNTTPNRKRKCVEAILVGEGDLRLVADVFGSRIYSYNGSTELDYSAALARIAEKGMKDLDLVRQDYLRKIELVQKMPASLEEFIEFMKNLSKGGKDEKKE